MKKVKSGIAALGAALAALIASAGSQARVGVTDALNVIGGYGNPYGHASGPGWTVAHVKRMARKAKNQKRHKAACRRAKCSKWARGSLAALHGSVC